MYLITDTETTGLPDFRAPVTAPHQPHIIQLAAILVDQAGVEVARMDRIVKPPVDQWDNHPMALAAHGLTREQVMDTGISTIDALAEYQALVQQADEFTLSGYFVAHNVQFDTRMLLRAYGCLGLTTDAVTMSTLRPLCTMVGLTSRICLPSVSGRGYKWPRLEEAWRWMFPGAEQPGPAHSAMGDATATRAIWSVGRDRGYWK